ncbi:MAG: hypothetical protein JW775_09455 [Candidatus Aminicenantes bacterium]|nr:hypothetical protein [Candidatus Aminicenantes bacterium]
MKQALAVIFASLVLAVGTAFPQGNFLKRDQYAFGLSGAYATNAGARGLSGTAGIALGGVFDLVLSAGRATYDSSEFADLEGTSLVGLLRGHVIKQNASRSPVSLAVSVGYGRDSFSTPTLGAINVTMYSKTLLVGGTVYRDVPLFARAYIQPSAGLGYTNTTLKFRDETSGLVLETTDGMLSYEFSLPIVYAFSGRALFVVQPGLSLNKDTTTFSISAGLVFIVAGLTR